MCMFLSWIEKDGKLYWLEDDIIEAKGWEFEDSIGHTAIEKYYGIKGEHKESYEHIPPKIAKRVNAGYLDKMMKAYGIRCRYNKKGYIEGLCERFYSNGQVYARYTYNSKGDIEGLCERFYSSGQVWFRCTYNSKGEREGLCERFYSNGQLSERFTYNSNGEIYF